MNTRATRVALAAALFPLSVVPSFAQVRPVILPEMGIPTGGAAAVRLSPLGAGSTLAPSAFALGLSAPSLALPAAVRAPALSLAASPSAVPAAAPALAAAPVAAASLTVPISPASAVSRADAPKAADALKSISAASLPESAPALDAAANGRRAFDGAALEGPAVDPSPAAAPAPRGDSLTFNGQTFPTRMFSDTTQISTHLIRAIDATKKTLDIAIYELAIREVHDALKRAKDRGVKVRIVMDQGHVYPEKQNQTRTPEVQALIDDGFTIKTLRGGDAHGIMHNKFAVFDGALLETGSFNWTRAADSKHFENALFDSDAARIASFQRYWNWMWSNARAVDLNDPPAPIVLDAEGKSDPLPPAPQEPSRTVSFNGVALPAESFTPHGTAALIVSAIDAAKDSVVVANFSFTHHDLIDALTRAKDRGLKVRIVFDRSQYGFLKEMAQMVELGFDVRLSDGRGGPRSVMHNKFVVLDGALVETGSFNWTFNGELNNYENAVFLNAPDDAAAWAAYFERLWKQGRAPRPEDHVAPPEGEGHAPHDAAP